VEGLKKRHVAGGLGVLCGVGLMPIKALRQVLSGFTGAGSRLGSIFGWDFVVVIFFVTILSS